MDDFAELMQMEDYQERNQAFKKAFSPITPPIDITNNLTLACSALLNLTDRLDLVDDVLNGQNLKLKLLDIKFINRCIETYLFRHSHNVKFPDYRARGAIRLKPLEFQFPNEQFNNSFGYAKNSAEVNISIFLCAEFIYKNELTNMGNLLRDGDKDVENSLLSFGFPHINLERLKTALKHEPIYKTLDDLTGNYLPQLRFPIKNNEYLSLTPVTSHVIQAKVHNYCHDNYKSAITHFSPRSSSVGTLAASVGGRLKLFKSLPVGLKKNHASNNRKWNRFELANILKKYGELELSLAPPNIAKTNQSELYGNLTANLTGWLSSIKENLKTAHSSAELAKLFNQELSKHQCLSEFAYQPSSTKLFINVFKSIRRSRKSLPESGFTMESQSEKFVVIPNLQVNDANALNSGYSVGFPSLTGVLGFIHKYQHNINELFDLNIQLNDFAICIHEFCLPERAFTKEIERRINNKLINPGLIDSITCDLTFSLVIRLQSAQPVSNTTLVNGLPTHFCGGHIHSSIENLALFQEVHNFEQALNSLPMQHGQWLAPYHVEKQTVRQFLNSIDTQYELILVNSGYLFLEKPKIKNGVIDNLKHAFVENILSVAKLATYYYGLDYSKLFWAYQVSQNGINLESSVEKLEL